VASGQLGLAPPDVAPALAAGALLGVALPIVVARVVFASCRAGKSNAMATRAITVEGAVVPDRFLVEDADEVAPRGLLLRR